MLTCKVKDTNMPLVTMPDGQVVNMPDQLTPELAQRLKSMQGESTNQPPKNDKGALHNFATNLVGGTVEPLLQQATGFIAKPIGEVAGLAAMVGDYTGIAPNDPQETMRQTQEALTYKPQTQLGASPSNLLNKIPQKIGEGIVAMQPDAPQDPSTLGGMATNAARESIPQIANITGFSLSKAMKASNINRKTLAAREGYAKDLADAQGYVDQGLKISPHEIKIGGKHKLGKVIEGVSNEKKIGDAISKDNQQIFNEIARKDIGIKTGDRITPEALAEKRVEAYQPYEQISRYGKDVNLKFRFDEKLLGDVKDITHKVTSSALAEERPAASTIRMTKDAVNQVRRDIIGTGKNAAQLSPEATIDLIKALREESSTLYAKKEMSTKDIQIAKVKYEAANSLENWVDRRLSQSGQPEMVSAFRDARKRLSKIHVYGEILNPYTGNLAVRQLSSKKFQKAPFDGGLESLRKFSTKYKDSSKPEANQRGAGISPIEAALAVTGSALHHPLHSAVIGGRVAARSALASNKVQNMLVDSPKQQGMFGKSISSGYPLAPFNAQERNRMLMKGNK